MTDSAGDDSTIADSDIADSAVPDLRGLVARTAATLAERHVGVVVAATRGTEIATSGAGHITIGGAPPDGDTVFEIGSITKVFTALSAAILAGTGAVDLDEPVRALLTPGTAVPARDGTEITLRHLATHTSGLPRLPVTVGLRALLRPALDPYASLDEAVVLGGLSRTTLKSTPGRRFAYSNLGAGLLGLALSRRCGLDYEALIRREVCDPLRLHDTRVGVAQDDTGRLATGHTSRGRPTSPWTFDALAGAGALRSTAADLVSFVRVQLGGDHIGDQGLAEAITSTHQRQHQINRWAWVGLGWQGLRLHARFDGADLLWHNGGTGGFRSWLGLIPERDAGVVVLVNDARSPDSRAFDLLRTVAFGGRLRR